MLAMPTNVVRHVVLIVLLLLVAFSGTADAGKKKEMRIPTSEQGGHHEFCVIGGGPGGLQTGHYLQELGFDYVIFERNNHPASFFSHYPRTRKLVSINKVHTGRDDPEFNLRHDWNSLLSDHPDPNHPSNKRGYFNASDHHSARSPLLFKEFSGKYYPHADDLVKYMKAFTERQHLNIRYEHDVLRVAKRKRSAAERKELNAKTKGAHKQGTAFRSIENELFVVYVQNNQDGAKRDCIAKGSCPTHINNETVEFGGPVAIHTCDVLLLGTGKFIPNTLSSVVGSELVEGYESVSVDPKDYTDQQVLIIGSGNSGQELLTAVEDETATVHVIMSRFQMAHQTHYVGHTRAVHLGIVDKYLLKSLDFMSGMSNVDRLKFTRCNKTNRILPSRNDFVHESGPWQNVLREPGNTADPIYRLLDRIDKEEERQEQLEYDMSRMPKNGRVQSNETKMAAKSVNHANKQKRNLKSSAYHESDWTYRHQGFDRVIRCLGFHWDASIFGKQSRGSIPGGGVSKKKKEQTDQSSPRNEKEIVPETDDTATYPITASDFQSVNVPNLYVVGSLMHFRDNHVSSGDFIHGFRYLVRSLSLQLAEKYRGDPFPFMVMGYDNSVLSMTRTKHNMKRKRREGKLPDPTTSVDATMKHLFYRLQNVSSLYQLQAAMSDVILMKDGYLVYMQDIPLGQVKSLDPRHTVVPMLRDAPCFISMTLEFGERFQGLGILHHHGQEEPKFRTKEKMMWAPDEEPDMRLSDLLGGKIGGDNVEEVEEVADPREPEHGDEDFAPFDPKPVEKGPRTKGNTGKSSFGRHHLHPVLRFYARPPNEPRRAAKEVLTFRLPGNYQNDWIYPESHLRPLWHFLTHVEGEMRGIEERGVLLRDEE